MRKYFLLLLAVLLAGFAMGQDFPRAELFGGYSYMRFNIGDIGVDQTAFNLNGWNASLAINANKNVGFVADFDGHYGSPSVTVGGVTGNSKVRLHNFLFGPKFSYRGEKAQPFVHALFGGAHGSTDDVSGSFIGTTSDTAFAMALGGGVDIKVNNRFAIRAVQADYLMTKFVDNQQNNFRLSFGVVFRLSKQ